MLTGMLRGVKLSIGLLGAGHFGRFHALKLAANPAVKFIGLHDAAGPRAAQVAAEVGVPVLDAATVIARADAVIVAAPTAFHCGLAEAALAAGKHVFIEKPIAATLEEADRLIALAAANARILQVGHIERFSAAIRTIRATPLGGTPLSFEATRIAPFRPRSLDVSVVLDLMIHDLDLVIALADAEPETVEAVGAAVMSPHPDFVSARLVFPGGRAATITASRVSIAMERRLRVMGTGGELRVDFLARSLEVLRPQAGQPAGAELVESMPGYGINRLSWTDHDSLEAEQAAFFAAVRGEAPAEADGIVGRKALAAALRIEAAVRASRAG